MADEIIDNKTEESQEIKGIYNINDIDKIISLSTIEGTKTKLLLNLNQLSPRVAQDQLVDLLSTMLSNVLEKYFGDDNNKQIKTYFVKINNKDYNFYQLKAMASSNTNSIVYIRSVAENSFSIYNHFARILGVEIATTKVNKKRLIDSLFGLIPNKNEAFYKDIYDGYAQFLKLDRYSDVMRNFIPYCIARMKDFDLDFNGLIIGAARGSKSTSMLQYARRIYSWDYKLPLLKVDIELIRNGWVNDDIIYSQAQGFTPIKTHKNAVIALDDAILVSDRREAMNPMQIKFLKYVNFFASNNNRIFSLIQNLEDLDVRTYSKANLVFLTYERGSQFVYMKNQNFPIIRDTFQFEKFKKAPYLLNSPILGHHHLTSLHSFLTEVTFDNLQGNSLYDVYYKNKTDNQEKLD